MKFSLLHNSRGITLIELLIVVVILGVLSGLAGPGFSVMLAERSIAAETRRVIGTLKLARSEARARGAIVTLSRSASQDWSGPIDIYVDATAPNQQLDTGTDDLVRREETGSRSVNAVDNQGAGDQWISFNMRGWLAEPNPVLIAVCSDALEDAAGMYIEINRVGKIRERRIGPDGRGCNP